MSAFWKMYLLLGLSISSGFGAGVYAQERQLFNSIAVGITAAATWPFVLSVVVFAAHNSPPQGVDTDE